MPPAPAEAAPQTTIGGVNGAEGYYHYRGYSASELAAERSYEDVWHLLAVGDLPDKEHAAAFADATRPARRLPPGLEPALERIAATGVAPHDGLRAALPLLAPALALRPLLDTAPDVRRREGLALTAVLPTAVAALHRLSRGEPVVPPRDDLGTAANYLYMLTGTEPSGEHARALERYLVAVMDHGLSVCAYAARVVASTGTDLAAAVAGALAALGGPLHGGAPGRVLDTLTAIGTPDRADAWLRDRMAGGGRVPGFGHAVYAGEDPRTRLLREVATRLGGDLAELALAVERRVPELYAELRPGRTLHSNVEFYAAVVQTLCGLPPDLLTATFACGRVVGWCAHVAEQADTGRRPITPGARYAGPQPPRELPT
ncbi:citrate/2-methylcitrate synthase [Streptomyces sp. B1866]|uniref:citrate/2-methylcitrate synthase n=1 Tax=Streptomyces sp. B1866 TaxID=3075431 RepID=UPI00288C6EEB|nr:citrate/2-methylcitrate synthase [Streptomyces sp. B1866]MDT3396704.1 citrate/2-methylcitrate synthase [Streptomyces sp. B1866]